MQRGEAAAPVLAAKAEKGTTWARAARSIGKSKEWTSAGLLGQMTFARERAEALGTLFGLPPEAVAALHLIHEESGDGIMSAIGSSMDIQREPDPEGDRVRIVMSGKFLPYKSYQAASPEGIAFPACASGGSGPDPTGPERPSIAS